MSTEAGSTGVHERRIGFPIFNLLFFILTSVVLPWIITHYARNTVPGALMSWVLVNLLTGGLLVYELLHWRKVVRFEIRPESVAFNTLSDAKLRAITFAEIEAFEHHPASQAKDALVIKLRKNTGQSYWKSSDNPVLTEPYGIRMRDLQRKAQAALDAFNARTT
ncbi:MAG: hypothetical protein J0L51_13200 [Rhizobiales bacterium]|nr:hypothetical protein [Hyphomicrobiales bacterium]